MKNNIKESQKVKDDLDNLGIETIIEAEVKKFGTSAHINISRKYLGRKVTIIIPKD